MTKVNPGDNLEIVFPVMMTEGPISGTAAAGVRCIFWGADGLPVYTDFAAMHKGNTIPFYFLHTAEAEQGEKRVVVRIQYKNPAGVAISMPDEEFYPYEVINGDPSNGDPSNGDPADLHILRSEVYVTLDGESAWDVFPGETVQVNVRLKSTIDVRVAVVFQITPWTENNVLGSYDTEYQDIEANITSKFQVDHVVVDSPLYATRDVYLTIFYQNPDTEEYEQFGIVYREEAAYRVSKEGTVFRIGWPSAVVI